MTGIQDALAAVRRALVNGAPPEIYEAAYPALHYVEAEIARLEQERNEWHRIADDNLDRVYAADQQAEAAEAEKERWKAIAGFRRERHKQAEAEVARLRGVGVSGVAPDPRCTQVDAHAFKRRGWRWWICDHCYAPRSLHPRPGYRTARPLGDNRYLSADAPHFREGW